MTETITLTREQLAELVRAEVQQQVRARPPQNPGDDVMEEAARAPRRSFPLSSKGEEMAEVAKIRGGLWHPDYPDIRKYKACHHAKPRQCDRCWTLETEARWAYALGLTDELPIPLDDPEERASQRANTPTTADERKRTGRVVRT